MKISPNTLSIFKWMTSVNGGVKIEPGNKLYTATELRSMCAVIEVEENFPMQFITSNFQKFLATVGLFEDPEFEFTEKSVKIYSNSGKNKTEFYQSDPSLVNQSNRVPSPRDDVALSFTLKSEDICRIFKASSVISAPDIKVIAKDGLITISAFNKANTSDTSDKFDIVIGECDPDLNLKYYYSKSNFKIISEFSYNVEIYGAGLTKFSAINSPFNQLDIYVITAVITED